MSSVLFTSLISRDDRPLYIQSFDLPPETPAFPGSQTEKDSTAETDKSGHLAADDTKPTTESAALGTADAQKFLKYNFLSHMALDVFALPMLLHLREQQGSTDGVLLLFIQEGVTVYGMETNNGLKVVVGMGGEIVLREALKALFLQVHKAYLKAVCNPFTDVLREGDYEKILQTRLFDGRMQKIVREWEN